MHTKMSYILPSRKSTLKGLLLLLLISAVMGLFFKEFVPAEAEQMDQSPTNMVQPHKAEQEQPQEAQAGQNVIYLPITMHPRPQTPFGVESNSSLNTSVNRTLLEHTDNLGGNWVRIIRINWRELQPNEGDPIEWGLLRDFDQEVELLTNAGMKLIVVVQRFPRWATIEETSCGAIREDKFDAFARFMNQVVTRYPEVYYWELGNEPDVDQAIISPDSVFGCWGDIDDPYYGGEHYGKMLKVVTPAIRAANPSAKVMIGGLLLARPNNLLVEQGRGRPELFLEGIIRAGVEDNNFDYFDSVGYHGHSNSYAANLDYTGDQLGDWGIPRCGEDDHCKGSAKGKIIWLRNIMHRYGVDKPLFLNESTLTCNSRDNTRPICTAPNPDETFYQNQATHVSRVAVRSLNEGIEGFVWYTINGPGWSNGALLDETQTPRPVYYAYQTLIEQIGTASNVMSPTQLDLYGEEVEAYRFYKDGRAIDVVWGLTDNPVTLSVPRSGQVFDQAGNVLSSTISGNNRQFSIGFETIYIHRQP